MAITKTKTVIRASASVPAGTTATDAAVDLTAGYGGQLEYKITNGASAPTTTPTIKVQVSPDNSAWYDYMTVGGDMVGSSNNSRTIMIPAAVMFIRTLCTSGATNASTFIVDMAQITAY